MIVSLLQLMGFGLGKSIQSRADSDSGKTNPSRDRDASGVAASSHAVNNSRLSDRDQVPTQAAPSRRPEVKTQPVKKAKASQKEPVPASRKTAKVPPKAAPKTAPKSVSKPVAKSSARPTPAKVAPKPASKPAPTAAAKVAPKSAPKKPVAKVATKPAPKVAAKAAAKPAARAVAPAKKTVAAPAKPASKGKVNAAATKPARAVKSSATPVAPKAAVKPAAKTKAAPSLPVNPKKKEIPVLSTTAAEKKPLKAEPEKAAVAPVVPTPAAVPARSPRVSSRLAQLTVPSMASIPAVASTAAKASYGHSTPPALPTPPHFVPVKKDPKLANNWKTKPVAQWTDEEVVAMPDSEYMNEGQMAFFRLKLGQLKRDILSNAGETTEHLREETVVVPDPADRATIEEEHALELRTRDRERKLLKKIEQSMARIDAGD